MVTIPEVSIKNILDYCLEFIKEDYLNASDKKATYLYAIFGESQLGEYKYIENAVSILTRGPQSPRQIETHIFLNPNRFTLPTIHISLPSDGVGPHGLGYDTTANLSNGDSPYDTTSERSFQATFNLVFTSDNTFEVLIMYNVIRACLIGNVELLEFNGLRNPIISGMDILLQQEINPTVYSRALSINCFYEFKAPSFRKYQEINKVNLNGQLEEEK